jgi:hypothetical protein
MPRVVHELNPASGGNLAHIEIAAFLAGGGDAPEKQALLTCFGVSFMTRYSYARMPE